MYGRWLGMGLTVAPMLVVAASSAMSSGRHDRPDLATPVAARSLSFEERVEAQRRIEQVYWSRRVWPKENTGPKPPLSAVVPDEAIRAKVEDYLKKSNALETWWRRPITPGQLQAEMRRMARDTRDARALEEIFRALGQDPFVIAETLARPTIVNRLIRTWYASDERLHGETVWPKTPFDSWWSAVHDTVGERIAEPAGTYTLASPDGTACSNDTWSSIPSGPDPRTDHTAVWTGAEMIVWGGLGQEGVLVAGGGGARYDPATDTWTPVAPGAGVAERAEHTAVWTGTEMIVWGGYDGNYTSRNTGGRYDPSQDAWTPVSTGAGVPGPRFDHTAVWTGTEMIVWGGFGLMGGRYRPASDSWTAIPTLNAPVTPRYEHAAVWTGTEMIVWGGLGDAGRLSSGGRYDVSANRWTATSTGADVPEGRALPTAVWTGTEMIVWGGSTTSGLTNTGGRYDPSTNSWSPTSTGPNVPPAGGGHSAVWTGAEMIVWGGGATSTGGRYDPSTDSWSATSTGPQARAVHTAVWTGTEMIVWGGFLASGGVANSGGRYAPSTDSWISTSTGDVPVARNSHTATWTGAEMIVWGGRSGGAVESSGGRYDPVTDSWTPTSMGAGVPASRYGHTAVWTGTEMIAWGGRDGSGLALNGGGRYAPSTDTWTPTSTGAAVPTGRSDAAVVWTGTEMIVWGGRIVGFPNPTHSGDGGRYDPSTDSWAAVSMANAPTPRAFASAVWTGTELIVWGGDADSGPTNTGGRYAPATDTWMPTTTKDVPAARSAQSAVWTDTEMIVWGGHAGYPTLNTGGRYDPTTDSWSATSTGAGVPSTRTGHTSVWTGSEMIVWDGTVDSFFARGDGGRYDPVGDTWSPISSQDAPPPRFGHTAVWTGQEMIVWGGHQPTSTGGRYCACPTCLVSYRDADGDGYGDPAVATVTDDGSVPTGYVADATDCDDADLAIHPGATEVCNGSDDDCDGVVDFETGPDADSDGSDDICDNCPALANADQVDFDGDGIGDACEADALLADGDNSGRVDGFDLALLGRTFGSLAGDGRYDPRVDFNRDAGIDGEDLALLAPRWGLSVPQP